MPSGINADTVFLRNPSGQFDNHISVGEKEDGSISADIAAESNRIQ